MVEGTVLLVEDRVRGQRILLGEPLIEALAPEATPVRVRVTVRRAVPDLGPGDLLRVRAVLMPPSAPAAPGDFDYARHAFFERLGAVGYALGDPERIAAADGFTLAHQLARIRQHIAGEINAALPGTTGAVANALLTGLRAAIPDAVWLDMQASGLAHLLAISGLHLGLVAGALFFAVRIGIALAPPLALRLPGKKVAGAIALVGAFGYLLISGAPVPTQRALIMTGVALVAVMVDRNPFSMRLIAFAALLVLLLQPESLLGASFQMSFAAVVALIAAYETGIGRRPKRRAASTGA
jgi:competence protein ComEC